MHACVRVCVCAFSSNIVHCKCVTCRFEDVQANRVEEIKRILNFMEINYNTSSIETQLSRDITTFKR